MDSPFRVYRTRIYNPHSHLQCPRCTRARNAWALIWERLVVLGCCLLAAVTKFQGKLASLQQVKSPNSQDNFQICCGDMYLVRFLANFAGFRVFLWISRDFADLLEIRGSATSRNNRSPECTRHWTHLFISSIYIAFYTSDDTFYKDVQVSFKARKKLYTVTFPWHCDINFPSKAEVYLHLIYNMGALKKPLWFLLSNCVEMLVCLGERLDIAVNFTLLAQRCLPLQQHCSLLRQRNKMIIREWTIRALLCLC